MTALIRFRIAAGAVERGVAETADLRLRLGIADPSAVILERLVLADGELVVFRWEHPPRAKSRTQDLTRPGYSNQLMSWLSLTEEGIDRMMRPVSFAYPARLLLERSRQLRVNQSPYGGASTCLNSLRR